VGAAGHCTGGHLAFRAAFSSSVQATVCWYPTGLHDGKLGKGSSDALERADEISGEILLIFGTRDPHSPIDARRIVRSRLKRNYTWRELDAEHAFGRDVGPRFDPEATDLAFAETVAFFRGRL
jgi:carboxymethylenebutenolidase